jgi:hypothetical protein
MIQEQVYYTVVAKSAFCSPQIHKHLTKEQAKDLAWELKNQQYKVSIEQEDPLYELGVCGNWD